MRARWSPRDTHALLQLIADTPAWRHGLFSQGRIQADLAYKVTCQVCLVYYKNDRAWTDQMQKDGYIVEENGSWVATAAWTGHAPDPIRCKITALKALMKRGGYRDKHGIDPAWTSFEQITEVAKRNKFERDHPYYFLLRELVSQDAPYAPPLRFQRAPEPTRPSGLPSPAPSPAPVSSSTRHQKSRRRTPQPEIQYEHLPRYTIQSASLKPEPIVIGDSSDESSEDENPVFAPLHCHIDASAKSNNRIVSSSSSKRKVTPPEEKPVKRQRPSTPSSESSDDGGSEDDNEDELDSDVDVKGGVVRESPVVLEDMVMPSPEVVDQENDRAEHVPDRSVGQDGWLNETIEEAEHEWRSTGSRAFTDSNAISVDDEKSESEEELGVDVKEVLAAARSGVNKRKFMTEKEKQEIDSYDTNYGRKPVNRRITVRLLIQCLSLKRVKRRRSRKYLLGYKPRVSFARGGKKKENVHAIWPDMREFLVHAGFTFCNVGDLWRGEQGSTRYILHPHTRFERSITEVDASMTAKNISVYDFVTALDKLHQGLPQDVFVGSD